VTGVQGYDVVAKAVLDQAVTDFYLGRRGKTKSGKPYPGQWVHRRPGSTNKARVLREDAEKFFFSDDSRAIRALWFYVAGITVLSMADWLTERIDARPVKAWYTLQDLE